MAETATTATIKNLRIRVTSDTNSAVISLDKLKSTILQIRNIAAKGLGLGATTSELSAFTASVNKIDTSGAAGQIRNLSNALTELSIATRAYGQSHAGGDSSMQAAATAEAFEEMRETVNEVNGQVEEMNKKLSSTKSETKKATSEANKLSEAFHSSGGAVSRLLTRIKNIALNRIIRSLLLSLRKGISEGLENFINYSEEAKSAMDQFATSSMYLKNSIAAALMPVLMQLIPVFQQIVGWIVKAVEAFSNFFAWTQGKSTYTAANPDFFVAWGEEADKTTKKTEKLKKSILGFDEINALSDNSSGSGASGGSSGIDTSDMFIEKLVDVEKAKDFWKEILKLVAAIGGALLLWKLAPAFLKGISQLAGLKWLAKGVVFTIALALEYIGIYESAKNIASGNGSIKDWIIASLSAALGIGVGAITFGATGVMIAIGVGYVAAVKGFMDGVNKRDLEIFNLSEEGKKLKAFEEELDKFKNGEYSEITIRLNTRTEEIENILTNYEKAMRLIDIIYELSGKEGKTQEEIDLLTQSIDNLNNLGFGELISQYDELTGTVNDTREAVEKLLQEQLKLSLKSAAMGQWSQNQIDLAHAQGQLKYFQEQYDYYDRMAIGAANRNAFGTFSAEYKEYDRAREEAKAMVKELQGTIDRLTTEGANLGDFLVADNFNVVLDQYGNAVVEFEDYTASAIADTVRSVTDSWDSAFREINLSTDGTNTYIKDSAMGTVTTVKTDIDTVKRYIKAFADTPYRITIDDNVDEIHHKVKNLIIDLGNLNESGVVGINAFWKGQKVGTYATGGFPEDGLFFANSGELVGGFTNGRTAVTNNEQIIAGIERGVENAMRSAGGMGGGDWTITIVDTEGNVRGSTVVTEAERVNRRSGTTVIPVGV